MFTLGNLVCGFFAIVVASRVDAPLPPVTAVVEGAEQVAPPKPVKPIHPRKVMTEFDPTDPTHNLVLSAWLIFLAMIFDALDGYVARLARVSSDFGAQLDSLCDLVTFGVAPAFLLVKMVPRFAGLHRETVWVIAALFAACAALRLARFNVETSDEVDSHLTFSGLPSPAAAASIAGFAIMFYTLQRPDVGLPYAAQISDTLQMVLPFFAVLVALLMVSRIPYPHVVNQILHGHRSFGHVVRLVFALVAIMVIRGYSLPIICCAFVLGPPLRYFWEAAVQRRTHEEPLF
jgi:CDP-diacylglycerol---serine O-phosphatidyltransferase